MQTGLPGSLQSFSFFASCRILFVVDGWERRRVNLECESLWVCRNVGCLCSWWLDDAIQDCSPYKFLCILRTVLMYSRWRSVLRTLEYDYLPTNFSVYLYYYFVLHLLNHVSYFCKSR